MAQVAPTRAKRSLSKRPQPAKDIFGPTTTLVHEDHEGSSTRRKMTTVPLADVLDSCNPKFFKERANLWKVSEAVAKSRRAVIISGAGISCSSGIPDFRSNDGLYNLVKERYPDAFFTGKDLFSSGLFNTPETTSLFYTFIAELARSCTLAQPTRTHHFIHRLHTKGKLLRSYTQNIDGLERRVGLESGGRGGGLKKMSTVNVEMHGDLGRVRCVLCMKDFEAREEWMEMFRMGEAPWCPACKERCTSRVNRSARALPVGSLRPSIVLYDEPHPLGEEIGGLQAYDLGRKPDLLLVMGTSLKVHGLKRVVREFAKAVHAKGGLVVFINLTPPTKEWEDVIDVHIKGETDQWVNRVEEDWRHIKPVDWELQTRLEGEVVKSATKTNPKVKPVSTPKGKSKKKEAVVEIPIQLPTPRPSQSPSRQDSSTFAFDSDGELTPPPSSPIALSSALPVSPSKRRYEAPPSPVSEHGATPGKKRAMSGAVPHTGVPATPGRGNLFSDRSSNNVIEAVCIATNDLDDDYDIPVLVAARSIGDKENLRPTRSSAALGRSHSNSFETAGVKPKRRTGPRVHHKL